MADGYKRWFALLFPRSLVMVQLLHSNAMFGWMFYDVFLDVLWYTVLFSCARMRATWVAPNKR